MNALADTVVKMILNQDNKTCEAMENAAKVQQVFSLDHFIDGQLEVYAAVHQAASQVSSEVA